MSVNFKPGDRVVMLDVIEPEFNIALGEIVEVLEYFHSPVNPYVRVLNKNGKTHQFYASRFALAPTPAGVVGRKDDSGKLDMTLLDDMPNAVKAVVEVMQWAVTKKQPVPYDRGSWQGVHADRYRAAILRHNRDACEQAVHDGMPARLQCDNETKLLHLAHIATSALMALENTIREIKETTNA